MSHTPSAKSRRFAVLCIFSCTGFALAAPASGQGSTTGPGNPTILDAIRGLQSVVTTNNQQVNLQINQILQGLSTLRADVQAQDTGIVMIDQVGAAAGSVTPGDGAGFPVTLSRPGSYKLAGNLVVPNANTTAIEITADNVTLDLNGFAIQGPTVCNSVSHACAPTGTGDGVDFRNRSGIAIVNGTVRGMGRDGLNGEPSLDVQVRSARVDRVFASSNGRVGMYAAIAGIMVGNVAFNNGNHGILCGAGCIIKDSVSMNNGGAGIRTGSGSYVATNSIAQNAAFGLDALQDAGYSNNVFILNQEGNIRGGISLGTNACEEPVIGLHTCP